MGSKNSIAADIVKFLPEAENFYDLFAGGCAVAHAAILSGKYKNVYVNDLDFRPVTLFRDAIDGKYKDEKRWISREDFLRLKDTDPYVALCWSFGNNAKQYLYGQYIEPWMRALHHARAFGDLSFFDRMGIKTDGSPNDINLHLDEYRRKYESWLGGVRGVPVMTFDKLPSFSHMERVKSLGALKNSDNPKRLDQIQGLFDPVSLQISNLGYMDVKIKPGSVIYCDIPYINTAEYKYPFNHDEFYDWCMLHKGHIFISEYNMPNDRFRIVWQKLKRCTMSSACNSKVVIEKIYIPI